MPLLARTVLAIGYLPAASPPSEGSTSLLKAMIDGGCDLVEVACPTRPVLDGPTIQAAGRPGAGRGSGCGTCSRSSRPVSAAAARPPNLPRPWRRRGGGNFN